MDIIFTTTTLNSSPLYYSFNITLINLSKKKNIVIFELKRKFGPLNLILPIRNQYYIFVFYSYIRPAKNSLYLKFQQYIHYRKKVNLLTNVFDVVEFYISYFVFQVKSTIKPMGCC